MISSIVWLKVYSPNKPTPENSVKKLGPENQLISRKIGLLYFSNRQCNHSRDSAKQHMVVGIIIKLKN